MYRQRQENLFCFSFLFQNVYDRLESAFTEKCLNDFGFSEKYNNWIMKCIIIIIFSVILNDEHVFVLNMNVELDKVIIYFIIFFIMSAEYLEKYVYFILSQETIRHTYQVNQYGPKILLSNVC